MKPCAHLVVERIALVGLLGLGLNTGCTADGFGETTAQSTEALSTTAARVLGLDLQSDWTASGATLASGSRKIQGTGSLSVSNLTYATVSSRALSTLGSSEIGTLIGFDIQIPEFQPNPYYFGAVQLFIDLPSRGIYNVFVGQKDLTYLPRGTLRRVEFSLSSTVRNALRASYSDLTIRFALNTPGGTGPYLLDRISFAHAESEAIDASRNASILGFETASAWTASAGTSVLSSDRTEKKSSHAVVPSGWTVYTSDRLATPSNPNALVGFDLRMPPVGPNVGWRGETQLYVELPSQGIFNAFVGRHDLSTLRADGYNRVSFTLPPDILSRLSQPFDDLRFKIVLNTPPEIATYHLDRFRFGLVSDPTETLDLALSMPANILPSQFFLLAQDKLSIGPGIRIAEFPGTRVVAGSAGPGGVRIGSGSQVDSIVSYGDIEVQGGVTVRGYLAGASNLDAAEDAELFGTIASGRAPLESVRWSMTFPPTANDFVADTDGKVSLAPGRYRSVEVRNGTLELDPGTFVIDRLSVAPATTLLVDSSRGSLEVATRSTFDVRGAIVDRAGGTAAAGLGTVAPVFIYAGNDDVLLPGGVPGSLIAPNASVAVRVPAGGTGSWLSVFGRTIDLFAVGQDPVDVFPGKPGAFSLVPSDVRVIAQGNDGSRGGIEALPIFVYQDNPLFFGGFAWQGDESGDMRPPYYVGGSWEGIDRARIALRRLRPGQGATLGWSGPLFPGHPPMPCCGPAIGVQSPTTNQFASFAMRGHNIWHGTTFRATRALRHASTGEVLGTSGAQGLYVALSPDVLVVPVVVIAWDGASELDGLTAAIDYAGADTFPGDLPIGQERAPSRTFRDPQAKEVPPDDIWQQCGIQIQVVKAMYLGGPDLMAERCRGGQGDEVFRDYLSDENLAIRLREALPPAEFDALFGEAGLKPIIVQYGHVRGQPTLDCELNYAGKADRVPAALRLAGVHTTGVIQINRYSARHETAHEIGHIILSSNGHTGDSSFLMSNGGLGTRVTAAQCGSARGIAGGLSGRYFNFNIWRGFSDPIPPPPPTFVPRFPGSPAADIFEEVYGATCCVLPDGTKQRTSGVGCFYRRGRTTGNCNVCCNEVAGRFINVDTTSCDAQDIAPDDQCLVGCCDFPSGREQVPRGECIHRGGVVCFDNPR